jgi:hypothetical protein
MNWSKSLPNQSACANASSRRMSARRKRAKGQSFAANVFPGIFIDNKQELHENG